LKDKIGHTTIDLGVAQEKLETYQDGDLKGVDPMDRLRLVRGHLVSFPLDFMCQEDLRPYFSESSITHLHKFSISFLFHGKLPTVAPVVHTARISFVDALHIFSEA
jgi:hypothetical protein